jgi:hypothetical protein
MATITYNCIIKINRMKCLGHIRRMEESSPCKKLTFSQLEGCRKKGRPKLRWLDDVLQDIKTLKVTAWWKKAQDRDSWKAVIKEAKAQIRRIHCPWPPWFGLMFYKNT